ncbi:MAG: 4-alpha-glucanotransferase [Casimicrobiaceae bacterium]
MSDRSPLDTLCEAFGIAVAYEDAWGAAHRASECTKRALLRAMGVDVATAAERAVPASQTSPLPPVLVAAEHAERLAVTLVAPSPAPAALEWRIDLEDGTTHDGVAAPPEAARGERRPMTLDIPAPRTPGYHRLSVRDPATHALLGSTQLIITPARCHIPPVLAAGRRIWGLALQLYALRSHRNWGIGDFTDLQQAIVVAAAAGADILGINPLHALFPARPEAASPYSPSNRAALNVLYIDVEAVADFARCKPARARVYTPAFQSALTRLRAADHVDYGAVAALKFEILELLYADFREQQLGPSPGERGRAFRDYQSDRGRPLRLHGLFDALHEHVAATTGRRGGWQDWPAEYRAPTAEGTEALYRRHADRAEYFQYLQWQAEIQLAAASEQARASGLLVGLYGDFAVGADAGGAETWSNGDVYAPEMHVGAPPDDFNLGGQDWGLPPLLPNRLQAAAYRPFIEVLRAAMRHAGALRIDHVMALMRLFWVPQGAAAVDGTYVAYPFADLLGIVALESRRNRCLVIGEDLGTVGPGVRAALAAAGVLSYRPLYFERTHDGEFAPPETYPMQALVTVGTHDLPTLTGFWTARDIAVRTALRLYAGDDVRATLVSARTRDRMRLLVALQKTGFAVAAVAPHRMTVDLMLAVHRFLARAPSMIMAVQLEDVFGQGVQVNLPSTTEAQYPNWRRKLAVPIEAWPTNRRFGAVTRMLRKERHPAAPPAPRRPSVDAFGPVGHPPG